MISIEPFIPAVIRVNSANGQVTSRRKLAKEDAFVRRDNPEEFQWTGAIGISDGKLYLLDGREMVRV